MNRILAGAIAGTIATIPMTLAMLAMHRRLPPEEQYDLPPREITEVVALKTGQYERVESQLTGLSLLSHFGYGAATGALYAMLFPKSKHPFSSGSTYGLAVWVVSYLGWLPAAKILRPATQHPARRNVMMMASHLVWGAGTALVERWAERKGIANNNKGHNSQDSVH